MNPKQDQLIKQLGLDTLPPSSAQRGVSLPWTTDLVASLLQAGGLHGASLVSDTALPKGPGEAVHRWTWSTPTSPVARVQIDVYVASAGPELARRRLVSVTTDNMMMTSPYVRGPADLGEVSATFPGSPQSGHVVWVFHNICVSLEKDDDPATDLLAIARAVQGALAQHVVEPLDPLVPRVDRVELSATEVRVNELLTVRVRMQGADPPPKFLVALYDRPSDVRVRDASLNLQLTADNPGNKALTILIADASTLLSTSAQATMVVKR